MTSPAQVGQMDLDRGISVGIASSAAASDLVSELN